MIVRSTAQTLQRGNFDALARVRRSLEAVFDRVGVEYESAHINVGRFRIHYIEYGTGTPIVLLHGAGPGSAIWFHQIAELGKKYRVIAPDNPVAGLSDRAIPDRPMYEFARDYFLGFLDAMSFDNIGVAGMSLGGLAALGVALEHPGRIRKLALIASAGLGSEVSQMFRLMTFPPICWFAWRPRQILAGYIHRALRAKGPRRPDLMALARYAYDVAAVPLHRLALVEGLRTFATAQGQRKVFEFEELSRVQVPTMIIWGARDRVFPVSHGLMARAAIPVSQLYVLERAGHAAPLDEPEQVSRLLANFFAA
ncbi:MAG: alpha/beta fold hydrolase [Chloroflexi bacterium]|nr:alpha/beta fold hydrolase [Chloroflexota bacterium]